MNTGDTAFVIICAALVFFMTPGLGFFYGGLGRRKNMVNNLMASYFVLGLCSVLWVAVGYTLAFGMDGEPSGIGWIVGNFDKIGFRGIGLDSGDGIPELSFAGFQLTFALITPALITGAIAGRMKFKSLFAFIALWSVIVYYPLAHMVWGGGLLGANGLDSIDFAGGNVVHISSGISALVLCIILGKRRGHGTAPYRIHNVPFVALGAGILWFGWYGFNAGSALGANGLAAHAFITTTASAAAGMLSWMIIDVCVSGKPTLVGACTGLVVGLVAITPGAGFVPIWASLVIGLFVSPCCFFAVSVVKKKLGYDDALDVFGCHGVGGIYGGIMTGVFARENIGGYNGAFYENPALLGKQVLAILFTIAWAAVGTLAIAAIVRLFGGLRVSDREEAVGLDLSEHGEEAYPSFDGLD